MFFHLRNTFWKQTHFLSILFSGKKKERERKVFFFIAFLCFPHAHSINCSVKRKSKGLNSIKNCSDYAMQFCSCYFITICHSSGHCYAPGFGGGRSPSTVLQGHFVPERHKSNLRACLYDCQQSLYHKPKSWLNATQSNKSGLLSTLIYLDNLRAWVSPWIT